MSIVLSVGSWGGFYLFWGWSKRISIGWVSITFFPDDIDNVIHDAIEGAQ